MTNPNGRFGIHGGQYIPETLMNAVIELEEAYDHYKDDPEFNRELTELLNEYAGRPSRLYYAKKMTEDLGGAKIYLKREDLNHTGAHKINNVLGQALLAKKMGKTRPEDELNCGSCGYNTCREKAAAIYHGKAEISMCLPYLKDKAESFSDCIVNNTPNGLIVVNDNLEVQQINPTARKIMNVRSSSDVLGETIDRILDPAPFRRVLNSKRSLRNERAYLADYKKYVEETIVYDTTYNMLVCIMRDITDEEAEREKKESISRQTVEVADKVVDKQMRIVQEIASLLGETAAETKIALTKLKESISDE